MYHDDDWARLARFKARKIFQEMQAEGLGQSDLPRKLREVAQREAAVVDRLVASYHIPAGDACLILQLALGDEQVARVGCHQVELGRSLEQALAAITILNGEEHHLSD